MALLFTPAQESDLESITATYNATIPGRLVTADVEPVTVESRRNWFLEHRFPGRPLWVVKEDNEYAGWMSYNSFYGRPAYSGTIELSIYLEPEFQGRGLGKTCLRYAIEQAPSHGVHTMLGFIFGHNAPSLALFEKQGFGRWGLLPGVAVIDGQERDLVIMGRKC